MWWTELSTEEDKMEDNRTQVTNENYKQIEYDLGGGVKTISLEQLERNPQEYQVEGTLNWGDHEATESSLIAGTGLQGGGFCGLQAETTEFKDSDLIYFQNGNEMLAQFTGDHLFILYDGGQDMVTVNLDTGDIKFGDNYTPDKAAQLFWETIGEFKVDQDQQTAELEYANIDWIEPYDPTEESYVGESAIDMVKKAIVNHKFDDAMKVID